MAEIDDRHIAKPNEARDGDGRRWQPQSGRALLCLLLAAVAAAPGVRWLLVDRPTPGEPAIDYALMCLLIAAVLFVGGLVLDAITRLERGLGKE